MASSSLSPPPPSLRLWIYEVFLSFRGEDTRKTFVDHLYSSLDQQGIYTYKDDETLPRGESIGPSLFKAIEESRISVIVFSKNYGGSSWCLDELAHIMKCRDERGQTVFPVFYDVDPSEVRKQEGEFGKAFSEQESKNMSKAESWRKALVDAANISGWEPKHIANGHESKFIKIIVDTISLNLRPLFSSVDESLIGIEARMQALKSLLNLGTGGVRMVGIWGVGGGGKTTLASSIYNEISHEFDGCSFIENVREESNKYGLKKLQKKVISDVLKGKGVYVGSLEEGKRMIKSRLCHRSVLIILDDVNHSDHLEALVGSHDWFGEGSRIIITTRDEHLLKRVDEIYGVSLLTHAEAIQLFRKHACREYKPVKDYEKLSQDVISYAGGLPLALKVLGSFLCDKDMDEWKSVLARLKDIPDNNIVEKLKISYDGLNPIEKELFLDIACLFRQWKKEEAMEILDACGFHPIIGVKVLMQKALITISDGCFDMHDLVQEMGHYIVQGEYPYNPEKLSRVWRYEDVVNICSGSATMENDKVKALLVTYTNRPPPNLLNVVANMTKLRLLHVDDRFHGEELVKPSGFLSNDLAWFYWKGYPASSFPTKFQPTMLGGLIWTSGLQNQLRMGLRNLKVLNLTSSKKLVVTPDLDGLPCLEKMILRHCRSLKDIHPSIGYHERLVFLNLSHCSELKMFPPIVKMRKLETLLLSHCKQLRRFPEIRENMDSLVRLDLDCSGIEVVPSSIGQYCANLVSLNLNYCFDLKSIEGNFQLLKHLRWLQLIGCERLEKLSKDLFDVESCLEGLYIHIKMKPPSSQHQDLSLPLRTEPPYSLDLITKPFKSVMSYIRLQSFHGNLVGFEFPHLPRFLKELNIGGCNLVDGEIPTEICGLSNLEILDLSKNEFSQLHFSLSPLPQLKLLNVSHCVRLVQLPELPSSIAVLKADFCDSLESLAEFPTGCKWLWKVSITRSNNQCVIGGERALCSMLQGNAIENHYFSLILQANMIPKGFVPSLVKGNTFTLQLPHNWSSDFTGFLIFTTLKIANRFSFIAITMKQEMGVVMDMHSQLEHQESNQAPRSVYSQTWVGYVSFCHLRHTAWWNSTYNTITFSFSIYQRIFESGFGVGLIHRRSKGDPTETTKAAINCSQFWDDEYPSTKTFKIQHDSKSTMILSWDHCP